MKRLLPLAFLVVATSFLAEAQSFYAIRRERSLILDVGTGSSSYFGELKNPNDYLDAKLNFNVGLQAYVTNRVSLRAEATWFQLKGSDALADDNSRRKRNLSFRSNNYEIAMTGAVNLTPNGNRYYRRPAFNLYGFAGIGFIYFNPKTDYSGPANGNVKKTYALAPLHTEGVNYSRFGVVIPFGLGARFRMGPNMNFCIEGGYRKTFTDYLDDVSTVHKDPASFSDPVAGALADRRPEVGVATVPAGTQRGNPSNKDGYFLLNVKIEYYLPYTFAIGNGLQNKAGGFNKKRSSSFYRYNKKGRLKK